MRFAIYFIPPHDDPLTIAAAAWLRRDPYTGATVPSEVQGLSDDEHALVTAVPRRYGFHATIKAPFRLAQGVTPDTLGHRLDAHAQRLRPVAVELHIAALDGFFALVPREPCPPLGELAAGVVMDLDALRAPIADDEIARRNVSRLSGRQLSNLMAWGYPYVFDEFRFHMTLTGPVPQAEQGKVEAALMRHFGEAPHRIEISQLVTAVEPEDHANFLVHSIHPIVAAAPRLTAESRS